MINIAQVAIKFNFFVSWQAPIYEQVIVVEEGKKEVMTFQMISYNQSEKPNKSCDSKVKVKLRRLRLIYINKFISRIMVSGYVLSVLYLLLVLKQCSCSSMQLRCKGKYQALPATVGDIPKE